MRRFILTVTSVMAFTSAQAIVITPSDTPSDFTDALLGPGITLVGAPIYVGGPSQSGTFTDGGDIGFDEGVVLSTGDVSQIPGPNDNGVETRSFGDTSDDDVSTDLFAAGDTDLDGLTGGFPTFDAAVLEFDFQFGDGSTGGDLFFSFVFASEEYLDFIDSGFNDVFGFFVDDVNVALVPGTIDPITINTVNDVQNSGFYRNNVDNTNGIANLGIDVSFDGLTTVIGVSALGLSDGVHTMKFAVADTSDGILDAAVFLQAGSFSSEPIGDDDDNGQPPVDPVAVPEPGSPSLLLIAGLVGLLMSRRRVSALQAAFARRR